MSNKPEQKSREFIKPRDLLKRLKQICTHNWGLKLICVALAILLWGSQISQDPNLTREKSFNDVTINRMGEDSLLRNGFIIVSGLNEPGSIQMRANVPQRQYSQATSSHYNVRVDLSRITKAGEQMLPIITTGSATYGQVSWMSQSEVKVQVDEYITRRRIPVELDSIAQAPAGFYPPPAARDPSMITISGPAQLVNRVVKCVAVYDLSMLRATTGTQSFALSFTLRDSKGEVVDNSLITVTSESVLIDTILVEQQLHALKTVDISLEGITRGTPAAGYRVKSITAAPAYLSVAGSADLLKSLKMLNIASKIDIQDAKETMIRSVRIEKPQGALYVSEEAVYVTIEIEPISPSATGNS